MKIITAEQLERIRDAVASVAGTNCYLKYNMMCEIKDEHGKWQFICWDYPMVNHDCQVKTYRGNMYIMVRPNERYTITPAVLELLNS